MAASIMVWSGCSLRMPLQTRFIGDLGRIEFRKPASQFSGIIVGAPHGLAEPAAAQYATAISDKTGAGLVIAYGFGSRRIAVTRPLVDRYDLTSGSGANRRAPGSIYGEFKTALRNAADGPLRFYLGIRLAEATSESSRIEVTAAGFTIEQIKSLKNKFLQIRDRSIANGATPKIALAIDPVDQIHWRVLGVKHHGVLMLAERGLTVRLPRALAKSAVKALYSEILSAWFSQALTLSNENPDHLPALQIAVLRYGRIEAIPARGFLPGIVIGAPHGTFDQYTSELVGEISNRTGIAAVIAKGFTPTECGGWRINVNRPTEMRYPTGDIERETDRAKDVYARFTETVFAAAHGPLNLYVDVHQNMDQENIDVATLGVSASQAKTIKAAYREIRERVLRYSPDVAKVTLLIEPIDQVGIGAWAAKDYGILRLARQSLHFELPAHRVLHSEKARQAYTTILTELINRFAQKRLPEVSKHVSTAAVKSSAKNIP